MFMYVMSNNLPFDPQHEQVKNMVPMARTSWLKKSVLIQAVLPTDTP
jgi:hypothetical protein